MRKIEVLDEGPHPDPIDGDDPGVLEADRKRLEQQIVKGGQLFRHGVDGKDPEQNYIGGLLPRRRNERGGALDSEGDRERVQAQQGWQLSPVAAVRPARQEATT